MIDVLFKLFKLIKNKINSLLNFHNILIKNSLF